MLTSWQAACSSAWCGLNCWPAVKASTPTGTLMVSVVVADSCASEAPRCRQLSTTAGWLQ